MSDITVKVFVAGTRTIKALDNTAKAKLLSIVAKKYEILIGDCYGADASVQQFLSSIGYENVRIFACNGHARNNIGNWPIKNVPVSRSKRGFDYYKQKDVAMVKEANCGFMIWDGESRGTLSNIINLVSEEKTVLLYLSVAHKTFVIKSLNEFTEEVLTASKKKEFTSLEATAEQIGMSLDGEVDF